MNISKLAVIGGDSRNLSLARLLKEDGYHVNTFALSDSDCATIEIALQDVDLVIGPIPFSNDGKTLNTPLYKEIIHINNFFKNTKERAIIIGGKLDPPLLALSSYYSLHAIDILKRDDFALLNAIPTVEGIIQIAIQETPFTLNGSNVVVIGYGRVGKILSARLHSMGAKVYVTDKTAKETAFAKSAGIVTISKKLLPDKLPEMNIIFNTAPDRVLGEELLKKINQDALIIDIASKPGGVDFEKARELSLRTIWALSLPGKVAPNTSAEIVRDTVYNILTEMEEME